MLEQDRKLVGDTSIYPFVVGVRTDKNHFGSGILVDSKSVLTCKHILKTDSSPADMTSATVITAQGSMVAGVLKDKLPLNSDLALLELPEPISLATAPLVDCLPRAGAKLVAAGVQEAPGDSDGLAVAGTELTLINKNRTKEGTLDFQLAGGVRAGYSGGPTLLKSRSGWLCVGVTRLGSGSVNFASATSIAVGMAHVRRFLDQSRPGLVKEYRNPGRRGLLWTAATVLLLGINWLLGQTPFGKNAEVRVHRLLQYGSSSFSAGAGLPVVVVDIAAMEKSRSDDGQYAVTSRDGLKQIINSIFARQDQWPSAIAIDVDFSPDDNGPITSQDRDFFLFCQRKSRERDVPIFLGVHRQELSQPVMWLGGEEFYKMAAGMSIPKDTGWMTEWVEAEELGRAPKTRLQTLSAAMADAYNKSHPEFENRLIFGSGWALTPVHRQRLSAKVSVGEFPVSYEPLEALQQQTIQYPLLTGAAQAPSGTPWRDKVVLIGYATSATDQTLRLPGSQPSLAGVYLHACAVCTLIDDPTLFWTPLGQFLIDLFLCVLVLITILRTTVGYDPQVDPRAKWERLAPLGLAVLVILGGVVATRTMHLLWNDFLLASGVLLIYQVTGRSIKAGRETHLVRKASSA